MKKLVATPQEAAEMLSTSPNYVYPLLEAGELPAYKIGNNWKIPIVSLEEYVIDKAMYESTERRKKCQKEQKQLSEV